MAYLEEFLPEFRKGAKIRQTDWNKDSYIEMNKSVGVVINNKSERYIFSYEDVAHSQWELFREPEPDWDYIIKNKCLCWFSNGDNSANMFGYLQEHNHKHFVDIKINRWENCRPVRRDEVTFYEDRKDD